MMLLEHIHGKPQLFRRVEESFVKMLELKPKDELELTT